LRSTALSPEDAKVDATGRASNKSPIPRCRIDVIGLMAGTQ
jgi:hypothetical protein